MTALSAHEAGALQAAAKAQAQEVLTFRLGQEEYSMDILRVQEIRSYEEPTRMVGTPPFIKGVLNLRGVIVPIVDLRLKFGLAADYGAATVTIVLNVGQRVVGIVVDSVRDVVQFASDQVRPAPAIAGGGLDHSHITGLGTLTEGEQQRMVIMLDIEQLMQSPGMGLGEAEIAGS